MEILVVAPVPYLELDGIESFMIDGFMLTRNADVINSLLLNNQLTSRLGLNRMSNLRNSHIIYFKGDSNKISILKDAPNIISIVGAISVFLRAAIDSLWFIKDNGVYINQCFVADNIGVYEANTSSVATNRVGENQMCKFTEKEMIEALTLVPSLFNKYTSIDVKHNPKLDKLRDANPRRIVNSINHIPYEHHRMLRATIFLQTVRATDSVIIKITYSVALLEALFSSSHSELSHQVSERVALYLGQDKENKKDIYAKVKAAYGIRSSYIHGDNVKGEPEKFIALNIFMDALTRSVFNKVFLNDRVFMLDKQTKGYKEIYEEYFKDLLFN